LDFFGWGRICLEKLGFFVKNEEQSRKKLKINFLSPRKNEEKN